MSLIELSTALTLAGSSVVVPFVNKVLEKSADRLGGQVDAQLVTLFTKAQHLLAATGREPQSVEPKLLKPIVENAPLETDPGLADLWAALLANAADPVQRVAVQPSFTEVLRQLTPDDAQVLAFIYADSHRDIIGFEPLKVEDVFSYFEWEGFRMEIALDNLLRLRLFDAHTQLRHGPTETLSDGTVMGLTRYGGFFLQAVTPPAP